MKKFLIVLGIVIAMVLIYFYIELITFGMGRYQNYKLIKYADDHYCLFVVMYVFRLLFIQFLLVKACEKLTINIIIIVALTVLNLYLSLQSFLSLVAGIEHLKQIF